MWIVIKQIDSALKWYHVRLLGQKKQNNNANASISWRQNYDANHGSLTPAVLEIFDSYTFGQD